MDSDLTDLASEAEWEIWYQDRFDRGCPRRIELAGVGLVKGLTELWARHLFETVQAEGQRGFSRFNLWWKGEQRSIEVTGDWTGLTRLRKWIFGDKRHARGGYVEEGDEELLMKVAATHGRLILAGQTSEGIPALAEECVSREDFERQLPRLERYPSGEERDTENAR